jgi:hypothetical protein
VVLAPEIDLQSCVVLVKVPLEMAILWVESHADFEQLRMLVSEDQVNQLD